MILSDRDIRRALEAGRIRIDPMPDLESSLGSVSIDFRLGTTFMVFEHSRHSYIDPRQPQSIGDADFWLYRRGATDFAGGRKLEV